MRRLFLLTDVDGLYTANPATDPTATRIPIVENIDKLVVRPRTECSQVPRRSIHAFSRVSRVALRPCVHPSSAEKTLAQIC